MPADFTAEEREGDENEDQQPSRPPGDVGNEVSEQMALPVQHLPSLPSVLGCLRRRADPAMGLESRGLRDQSPNFSRLEKPFARHVLEMPLPGRAWRGRHLPILQQTQACQQPIPPLPTAPLPSPLPGTSRTSQTPPRNPDKLQHKLPRNTILSSRSPIPAFLSVC